MATFTHLFNKKVFISRKVVVSGYKSAMSTVTGAFVHLQRLSDEKTQIADGVFGKTFIIYLDPNVSLYEGDKIRDNDTSEIYLVKKGGITQWSFGSIDYQQAIIEKTT